MKQKKSLMEKEKLQVDINGTILTKVIYRNIVLYQIDMPRKIIVASGFFSPLHSGHIEYLRKSKELGDILIVIVNNDKQSVLKKGFCAFPASERVKIVRELECVDVAVESIDEDRSVCKTLAMLHPDIFANGGDQFNKCIPEAEVCDNMGIEMVDGLGEKVQSSRWILKELKESLECVKDGYLS